MIANQPPHEATLDFPQACRVLRRANAFFLVRLARIVDISRLSEGDAEEDYFFPLQSSRLHDVSHRLSGIKLAALDRFNVGIGAMAIPERGPE